MGPELIGKCSGCGKQWPEEQLDEIHDFWGRVLAGDEMPLGQCPDPDCGILCYLVREPPRIVVTVEGELVQEVADIPHAIEVEVRDFDNENSTGEVHKTPDGREYTRTRWSAAGAT